MGVWTFAVQIVGIGAICVRMRWCADSWHMDSWRADRGHVGHLHEDALACGPLACRQTKCNVSNKQYGELCSLLWMWW